jgi:hypothetical protein
MYPAPVALPYQLGKAYLSLLLHLLDELEQPSVIGLVACDEVGSTAQQVVTVLHATHERVEFLTSTLLSKTEAVKTILLPQWLLLSVLGEAHGGNVYIGILK